MSNSYIKFKAQENGIRKIPNTIDTNTADLVSAEDIPISNPDFADKINEVSTWLIEFEGDSYYPDREVGLNAANQPIVIMPWKKNYGYWTDNNLTIKYFRSKFNSTDITKEEFEKHWKFFESKNGKS